MSAVWIGFALLAAAILDGWLTLRLRRHTLPASHQDRLTRLRRSPLSAERVCSPVQHRRLPTFTFGLGLVLGGLWLFGQPEPYVRLPPLAGALNQLIHLDVPPPENTLLGTLVVLWGGVLLSLSLRPARQPAPNQESTAASTTGPSRSELPLAGVLLAAVAAWGALMTTVGDPDTPHPLLLLLWAGSLAAVATTLALYDRRRGIRSRPSLDRLDLLLLGLLLTVGFTIGGFRLGQVPAGMVGDEGAFLDAASLIARGPDLPSFFGFGVYSFPMASSYLQAAVLRVLGLSMTAWRLASVIPAVLAVVPTYLLARLLFGRFAGFLAGGLLLTNPYFLAFARLGYNNAQSILPVALALYCLLAGLRRRSTLGLFVSGVACGLGFYTYTAGRLGLIVAGGYVLLLLWQSRRGARSGAGRSALRPRTVAFLAGMLLLGWAMTTGPHLAFGANQHPGLLGRKTMESAFPNVYYGGAYFSEAELFRDHPPLQLGETRLFYRPDLYLRLLARGAVRTGLAFLHPRLVDSHFVFGALAGLWAAPFLVLGLARSLAGARRRGPALLLLWFLGGTLLLSVINTFPPRHQHLVAVIPAMSILSALGLHTAAELLATLIAGRRRLSLLVLALAGLATLGANGLNGYFVRAQQHFLPIFEDRIAFEALGLKSPRTLLYVYDDPERASFVPLLLSSIPNRASYQAVSVHILDRWTFDPDRGYTLFFDEVLDEAVRSRIPEGAGPTLSREVFRDAGGRVLGMAYRFGPGSPSPAARRQTALTLPPLVGGLAVALWLMLLVAMIRRHRLRSALVRGESADASPAVQRGIPGAQDLLRSTGKHLARAVSGLLAGARRAGGRLRVLASSSALAATQPAPLPQLRWFAAALELAALAALVLALSSQFLTRSHEELLRGSEYGVMSHPDQVVLRSLRGDRVFPLWDPYIRIGHPLVADPFQHTFNPLVTVPILLAGVTYGFKLAVCLSLLAAAWGQWALGRVLGFDRPARLWSAAAFALNGQALARFLQGQYTFIFSYGWIPFVLAGLVLSLRHRRPVHYAMTAVAMALLYFSGTTYYPFFMALLCGVLAVALGSSGLRQGAGVVWRRAQPVVVIGLLTVGLTALQLLPTLQFRQHLVKPGDPQLEDSLTPGQALQSLVSESLYREELLEYLPPEEYYAYVGVFSVGAALLAVGALLAGVRRREVAGLGILLLLSLAWVALRYTPLAEVYRTTPLLYQFRYPSRALILAILALINLAGLGLTWASRALQGERPPGDRPPRPSHRRRLGRVAAGLLMILMVVSVGDVFRANLGLVGLTTRFDEADIAMRWLRRHDPGLYYVGVPKTSGWHDSIISQGLRYLDAWYGFEFIPPSGQAPPVRPFRTAPNYIIQPTELAPPYPDAVALTEFLRDTAYAVTDSLPFAFFASDASLDPMSAGELSGSDVVALAAEELGPNRLRVRGDLGQVPGWVVVRAAYYPGWRARLDGRPAVADSVGGYLATRAVTGEHEYAFSFSSPTFNLGLVVSGLTLIVVFLAVVRDPVLTARTRAALASARSHLRTGGRELAIAAARRLDRVRQWVAWASRLLGAATARLTDLQTRVVAVADRKGTQLSLLLFALALCVYLATRLIRLQDFPIYFFTDEAVQTVLASDFARDGFHDSNGVAWPTYFENSSLYNLSLSVYLQVLPAMLLPRSVFVTRAIPALVTLGAAMALALILKDIFRARTWWAGPLLLAVVPTWFLHSRTAFETTLMVSFYAWFLYFYLRYRQGSPRHLYPALLCGGLAFYSYSPGQLVVVATGLLLLLFDFRYHWAHRRAAVGGGLLLALLALPYVRFQQQHPGETYFHLRMVGSHWFVDLPWLEKLGQSIQLYLQGLDPGYWFFPHERELMRHSMHGYAFIPTAMLPLVILALVRGPRLWSAGSVRALLLAALAVPVGAAMAGLGITRVLAFVIPVTALAALGLEALATPIRPLLARRAAGLGLVAGLSLASFGMLSDAVTHGPTWYDDYGLYGMQFGARQVFGEVRAALARTPAARVVLSPIWANGTDVLLRYFLPGESRIILQGGVSLIENPVEDLEESIYVLTPEEFQAVRESPFFGQILLLKILPYPDGRPGFYFLSLRYAPDAQERFARQLELRRQPVTEDVQVDGEWITVQHSPFDLGDLKEIFDGDPFTVTRTRESNPAVLALTFRTPRPMSGLSLSVSTMELTLRARVQTVSEGEGPQTFVWEYSDLPNDPTVEAQFWETPRLVQSLTLEIENRGGLPLDKIHIIDLILR